MGVHFKNQPPGTNSQNKQLILHKKLQQGKFGPPFSPPFCQRSYALVCSAVRMLVDPIGGSELA